MNDRVKTRDKSDLRSWLLDLRPRIQDLTCRIAFPLGLLTTLGDLATDRLSENLRPAQTVAPIVVPCNIRITEEEQGYCERRRSE